MFIRFVVPIAVTASLLSACSFAFVRSPPQPFRPTDDCSASKAAPVVDTLVTAGAVILGVAAAAGCAAASDDPEDDVTCPLAMGGLLIAVPSTLVFGGSALYGYSKTSDCRAAKRNVASVPRHTP